MTFIMIQYLAGKHPTAQCSLIILQAATPSNKSAIASHDTIDMSSATSTTSNNQTQAPYSTPLKPSRSYSTTLLPHLPNIILYLLVRPSIPDTTLSFIPCLLSPGTQEDHANIAIAALHILKEAAQRQVPHRFEDDMVLVDLSSRSCHATIKII